MKTKILITVKTYPTLSEKYEESVCTVGINESDQLIRIYPIPFRGLPYRSQYKKYDWIELDLIKNTTDFRPESFSPINLKTKINVLDHVGTESNWHQRKQLILKNVKYDIKELILDAKNKNKYTSLAVFKPTEIIRFHTTSVSAEWGKKQISILSQQNLFERKGQFIKKLPFKFIYEFKDCNGIVSKLMIEDWEIGELFWKSLVKHCGNTDLALIDVKQKFWGEFVNTKDIFFFLGTTRTHHLSSKNPFIIIGVFYPKNEDPSLFPH